MSTMPRFGRIIGLLSLAVALAGCSAIKLGYANLPEVAYWWLDGYVDLDDVQSPRVREDLARIHAWHKATELPRFLALLQRLEKLAPADATAEQVCAVEPELRERFAAVRDQAEPAIVTTAMSLAPEQLLHLERKYAQNLREYGREWVRLSPAERRDKRAKELTERLENVYGSLHEAQRTALRQQLERSAFDPALTLAERRRRQQDTLAVLRRITAPGVSLQDARLAVRGLVERFTASPDAAWRSYQDTMRAETCRLIAAVHNAAPPEQRENAARKLRGWQRDFTELSGAR
jgi:hypothetical protein